MASTAQLQQELINAVTKVRLGDGSPVQVKFSDGKTRTVYRDGSGAEDLPGVNFRNLEGQFNQAESAARPAPTPIAQVAPQPAPQPAAQPAQSTPVSQVTPAATASSNQLPTLKQSIIDEQFKNKRTNELTSFNSDIRDQIYNAGWSQKSDAVRVLNGAGVYGVISAPEGMGGTGYKSVTGKVATDQDFINAAKAAGIDPSAYYSKQAMGMGGTQNVLNKTKLYDALQAKGKDLYSVTNALTGAARGEAAPHATVLYKSDGSGNLVPQNNPETGQPEVKYFQATRYANPESFMDTWGPFLALAPAVGGIIGSAMQAAGVSSGTLAAANSAGGGFAGGAYGSIGPAGFTASAAAPITAGLNFDQVGGGFNPANGGNYGSAASQLNDELMQLYGVSPNLTPEQLAAAQQALGNASQITGISASQIPGMNAAAQAAGIGGGLGTGVSALSSLGKLLGLDSSGAGTGNVANALGSSALTNLLGSGGQSLASYFGGQAQADAAKEAAKNQMSMFNTINTQLGPQRGAGYSALNQIRSMLPGEYTTYGETGKPTGMQTGTDYLTRQFTPQDLQAGLAPNYQFMLGQGQQQAQRQANVAGGGIGGNALRALQEYTQNYAGNAYQNAFGNFQNQRTGIYNTLAGIAGLGQQAVNTGAQAGQAATTAAGQLGVGSAAAQAAGITGAANAAQGGLQNYQQNQILQAILGQNQNVAQTATPPYAP